MARVGTLQASFSAGELSPRLYGRADIAKYATGLEACENYIVRPEGGVMRRHGSRFAGEVTQHSKAAHVREFIFSSAQAYLLVFEDLSVRFYKNGAPVTLTAQAITNITKANPAVLTYTGSDTYANGDRVLITGVVGMGQVNNREFTVANRNTGANTFELAGVNSTAYDTYTSGGTVAEIYQLTTPYLEAHLGTLYFAQSADVLYITHGSYAPRTLSRTTDTSWALTATGQEKGPFAPLNTNDAARVYCTVTGGAYQPLDAVTVISNTDIFTAAHVGTYFRMQEIYFDQLSVSPWEPFIASVGVTGKQVSHEGNVYQWVQSNFNASTGTTPPTHTVGDAWDGVLTAGNGAQMWRYLHSRWGIVKLDTFTNSKQMSGTIITYLPNGLAAPAKTITGAANAAGLIRITSAAHNLGEGDYVKIAGVTGTTEANGDWKIINVAINTFDLFGSTFVNAYAGAGTARRFSTWLWQFGAFSDARGFPACVTLHEQRLVYGNTLAQPTTFWASKSGDYGNFYPGTGDDDSIDYTIASNQVDPIRWLASGSDLLVGTLSQEMAAFGGGLGDPITPSNTRTVQQSGEGAQALQPIKAGKDTLIVNRAGRKIFAVGQDEGGNYAATDLLELAEHLTVGKTIVDFAWAKNPASLIWALRSDGSLISGTYRPDQELLAWARHPINGFVESIAVIPSTDGTTDDLWASIRRTINGGTVRYIEYVAPPFEPTSATDKDLMGYVDSGLRYSGAAVTTLSGLFHLEGQTVKVVGNGSMQADKTVTNGKITVDSVTSAWVGLAFTSRLRTLRAEGAAQVTGQNKTGRIARFGCLVHNAIGGTAGPADESTMEELVKRELNDPMDVSPPMRSGWRDTFPASDFDVDKRVAIVQADPMPLDILAIAPVLSVQE